MPGKTAFNMSVETLLWDIPPINKMLTFSDVIYLKCHKAFKIDIEGSLRSFNHLSSPFCLLC